MIATVFPLITYLHIFQLEGYKSERLFKWVLSNFFKRQLDGKKPLVWTQKVLLLYDVSIFLTVFIPFVVFLLVGNSTLSLLIFFLLIVQPYFQLILSLALLKPYEIFNKKLVILRIRGKISKLNNLQVIGITGSYGKTSTKEFLYQILRTKYKVFRTPASYNTVFGIAKVIDLELDKNYDFFICEMGAYKKGEILELCKMVNPKYGILTGITEQHLERFGSLENIIEGKFELIDSLPTDGFAVLNGDNEYIVLNLQKTNVSYFLYGVENPSVQINASNVNFSDDGTEFILQVNDKKQKMKTKLIGNSNIQNIIGAASLAFKLGINLQEIAAAVNDLEAVPNRLELLSRDGLVIVNDGYNSNPIGFREAIETVRKMHGKSKIIVTPGIVELGNKTTEVHKELGKLSSEVFDYAVLVGKNERTISFEEGLRMKRYSNDKIKFVEDLNKAQKLLKEISTDGSIVLFENDLPDNY